MDAHDIEQAIEEELEKMSGNFPDLGSDSDTDNEEDFTASNEKQENDLPDSVLAYFKASSNRVNTFEQLILKDIDDFEIMRSEILNLNQHADLFNESAVHSDEDPLKLKERIMAEIEEEVGAPCETYDSNGDYDTEHYTYKNSERQFMFEWRNLEERLRNEEEQRLTELEAEKEQRMKCRSEQFREELRRTEAINQFEHLEPVEGDGELSQSLPLEMVKQQELIKRLEEQIEEERRVFEEVKQEELKRLEACYITAATKLQAAFRGMLVRRWSKKELIKKREEEKRRQEKREEREKRREREEKIKMEWENERKRIEGEEQHHRDEAERRRAEYEKAKQLEHHRLESEHKLEEQRRKEKEKATRIEEGAQKRMKERRVEEEMKNVQEEKKIREQEKAKMIGNEIKIKKEVELPEGIEERRAEEEKRKVQEDKVRKNKEEEKAQRTEVALKIKDEEELPEKIKQKIMEEVIRHGKVQEDEKKTREEEEKVDGIKRKDEKTQKGIKDTRVDEERIRNEMEEAQRKEKEEEKQKKMEIERMKEEKRKVQVEDGKERKDLDEAKRTEAERKRQEEEKQKQMDKRRVEEKNSVKEENEEISTEAEIKRKEEEENQNRMNKKREVPPLKITLKQIEKLKENETGQMQEEERKKLKQKDIEREEIVMKRNADGEIIEERSRNVVKDDVKEPVGQRDNSERENEKTTKWRKDEKFVDNESRLCLSQSDSTSKSVLTRTLSSITGQDEQHCFPESTLHTLSADTSSVTVSPSEEKSVTHTREPQCAPDDSSSACLSDSTENKRLAWMMNCTPWSKLSIQNKKKGLSIPPRRRGRRTALGQSLLPLPADTVLKSGSWSSLKQVTAVTLEDLSGCSLSTLSECTRLRSLTLRRCRLQALDGLNQCAELQHIDLQDNNISYVDCGGLTRLEVLLLGRNQLTSIHGLDNAVNLTVLQLSHNDISRISGLGSLKRLHRLTVDHNQLISTRRLDEAFTLLHLDCSYNHLSQVEGLENCALLNTLDLRGNNLTEMPVLENHVLLREVYLDDNIICSLHGLDSCWLPLLRCLSVPQNSITQLPLLVDLVSLRTIDVSHNCLSDLRNICMSLQGCTHLQELSIIDNPVQQENNWRSSVLAVNPSLIKLNREQTGASGKLFADSTQLWSFQALCQAHQDQTDSVLQRHCIEISSAPSALQAQLLVGNHAAELFQLAEEQRYAHEYGGVCETAMQDTVASSHQQKLSNWDLTQEKNAQEKTQHPAEHKTHKHNFTNKCQFPSGDHNAGFAGSPTQKIRDTQPSEDRYSRYGFQASRMDLRTVAVMVIQRRWREHRQRRNTRRLGTPAKAPARLSPKREVKSCTTRSECLNKDNAATVIQAAWRGYTLRKRLTRALMLVQLSDGDEAFEEVDMDEFIFDEEAMEKDWSPLRPDMSPSLLLPYSEQLLLPKPLLPLQELHKSACVQLWKPRQAWIRSEEAPVSEQSQSPDSSTRGISSDSTAYRKLKRAQKMKTRKQQHQSKLLAGRRDVSAQEALRGEPEQTHMQKSQRTYQWLQTQAMSSRRSSAPSTSDHFLPEIDPEILNGGRVQLVASIGYREAPDSAVRISETGFSSSRSHQAHSRAQSAGYIEKNVTSPQRVTLAPSQKERISFRDNPVQLSGGWGGGKKRFKANKFK